MKITNLKKLKAKDLIVFDLDGTLARTKSLVDQEMMGLLKKLLESKQVAIIGGGKYQIFQSMLLGKFHPSKDLLKKLFIFPTTGTSFYRYGNGWKKVYAHIIPKPEVEKINQAFQRVFDEIGYKHPEKTYGELIENRGTQVSFSVYGQDVVKVLGEKGIKMKEEWKRKYTPLKMKIAKLLSKYLSQFEVRAAGFTTIDVTRKGIDKAYGIKQMQKYLHTPASKMFFVGDAIFPGGNDYAVIQTGIDYVKVSNPEETKKIIRKILE